MSGTLKLTFGSFEYDLGIVTSFTERYSKSVSTTPIPTMSEASTFAIESGSSIVLSLEFSRVTPDSGVTSGTEATRWTNGYWYNKVRELVDRWQARTDGCTLTYTPGADNPYLPEKVYNGYIKTMTRSYKEGDPTVIYTSIEFHVGTMLVNKVKGTSTNVSEFRIYMSTGDLGNWCTLMNDEVNCISSYTIEGGMEQPFESITMSIPKNRLSSVAPELVDNIVAGSSKVVIQAVGRSEMTVVKCKLSNKTYKITAYCDAEAIKGAILDTDATYNAWDWIVHILTSGLYGMSYVEGETFHYALNVPTGDEHELTFKKGQNMWYILQVCALYLGCKIFFANGYVYCVDYRQTSWNTYSGSAAISSAGYIDLYPTSASSDMYGRITGEVTLGDEGVDTVINTQSIQCSNEKGASKTVKVRAEGVLKERAGNTLYISELKEGGNYKQATRLGENLISYREEPQQSVSFSLKEMQKTSSGIGWVSYFDPSTRADEITSKADDFTVDNLSVKGTGPKYQKLLLSQYERAYPEGYTTYTFGVMSNIDLSVSTSQIVTSQSNSVI